MTTTKQPRPAMVALVGHARAFVAAFEQHGDGDEAAMALDVLLDAVRHVDRDGDGHVSAEELADAGDAS